MTFSTSPATRRFLSRQVPPRPEGADRSPLERLQTVTRDGGLTWSAPLVAARVEGEGSLRAVVIRTPDGNELGCLMRENKHKATD
jgi:hypothetical protein